MMILFILLRVIECAPKDLKSGPVALYFGFFFSKIFPNTCVHVEMLYFYLIKEYKCDELANKSFSKTSVATKTQLPLGVDRPVEHINI